MTRPSRLVPLGAGVRGHPVEPAALVVRGASGAGPTAGRPVAGAAYEGPQSSGNVRLKATTDRRRPTAETTSLRHGTPLLLLLHRRVPAAPTPGALADDVIEDRPEFDISHRQDHAQLVILWVPADTPAEVRVGPA